MIAAVMFLHITSPLSSTICWAEKGQFSFAVEKLTRPFSIYFQIVRRSGDSQVRSAQVGGVRHQTALLPPNGGDQWLAAHGQPLPTASPRVHCIAWFWTLVAKV